MSGTTRCFYDWAAREFERVANLLRSTTRPRDVDKASELAALAKALRKDCDCCRGAMSVGPRPDLMQDAPHRTAL